MRTQLSTHHETVNHVKNLDVDCSTFGFVHELFRHRAEDPIQIPLIAFPKSGAADYEHFTAIDLDRYSNLAAWHYSITNIQTRNGYSRIALLGPTSLDWVINFFGLSLAGYTVLTLSPRLSAYAIVKLMEETHCECLIYHNSPQLLKIVEQITSLMSVQTFPVLTRKEYDQPCNPKPRFERSFDFEEEAKRPATIAHSSGSTGIPTSVEIGHGRYTTFYAIGPGDRDLNTLPLYHSFPLQVSLARMYMRKTIYFLNPDLPMTCEGLVAAIHAINPGTLAAVPYTLKLLAEQQEGVDALKGIGQVVFTGSPCPDDLGDRLTEQGVNLATFIGITESGFVGSSIARPPNDRAWNYVRPPPPIMNNIYPKPVSKDAFEFVFLENHPGRLYSGMTNSDDPPNSFHSRDLYTPHKSIKNAWKFLGRLDDRVTLINGEKVLPLPIEGRVRQHRLVKEAVVFGIGRAFPGLLLLRSQAAQDEELSDEDFIHLVWPTVEAANHEAEGFSQIGKDMIVPLATSETIPTTDKGTVIRLQVYNEFESQIEAAYVRVEQNHEGTLNLDGTTLETYLMKIGQQLLGPQLSRPGDDLFSLGLNSLQAIQMRAQIIRDICLGGNARKLSQNVIYEQSSISNLVKHLESVRKGEDIGTRKPLVPLMEGLVSKFSVFQEHSEGFKEIPGGHIILLTGATGSLGAHVLHLLLQQPHVTRIHCLIRGKNPSQRLQKSFSEKHLSLTNSCKLEVFSSDVSEPHLGLSPLDYKNVASTTTHIIHCAWPVNFQLSLSSFTPSVQGLHNLIQLSLSSPFHTSPQFFFCSSISVALGTHSPARIPESTIKSLEQASDTGYAASKLVGERIVEAAVKDHNINATILRFGQVVGDMESGIWNDSEVFPLIIRSAVTMGMLPEMKISERWLPLNTGAESILDIAGLLTRDGIGENTSTTERVENLRFYNIRSPHSFSWNRNLLPSLHKTKLLAFETVTFETWIARLRGLSAKMHSEDDEEQSAAADPNQNPAVKLVDFLATHFSNDSKGWQIEFETGSAEKASPALRNAPKVIESGLLEKMVEVWMTKWKQEGN